MRQFEIELTDGTIEKVSGCMEFDVGPAGELKVSEAKWTFMHTYIWAKQTYAPGTWLKWRETT